MHRLHHTSRCPALLVFFAWCLVALGPARGALAAPPSDETTATDDAETSGGDGDTGDTGDTGDATLTEAPTELSEAEVAEVDATVEEASEVVKTLETSDRLATVKKDLDRLESNWVDDSAIGEIEREARELAGELDDARSVSVRVDLYLASIAAINRLETRWTHLSIQADGLDEKLDAIREREKANANQLERLAKQTASARKALGSEDVGSREVLAKIDDMRGSATGRAERIGRLQKSLTAATSEIDEQLQTIVAAGTRARRRIFARTEPILWSSDAWRRIEVNLARRDWNDRWENQIEYIVAHPARLIIQVLVALVLGLVIARTRDVDPEVKSPNDHPFLSAAFIVLLFTRLFHPTAPAELTETLALFAALPAAIMVFVLLPSRFRIPLVTLMVLVVLDSFRSWLMVYGPVNRSVVIAVGLVAAAMGTAYGKAARERVKHDRESGNIDPWHETAVLGAGLGVALLVFSAIAAVFGWSNLAGIACTGTIRSAYLALLMYFGYRLLNAALASAVRSSAAQRSRALRLHANVVLARLELSTRRLAVVVWLWSVLGAFQVRRDAWAMAVEFFGASYQVGSTSFSPGNLAALVIGAWLAMLVNRFILFALREEALPRLQLRRGMPEAITTLARIGLYAVAFFVVLAAGGIRLERLAIMFGALGVGIGLGLQSIVNNFVAGLVLLFERPINTGDVVELTDGTYGRVTNVGLRSSRIRTWPGAEVVVPNSALTNANVTNWTLSDDKYRIKLMVGVAYGNDAAEVRDLLTEVLKSHDKVLDKPEPIVHFLGFGDSSLDFELRAWTDRERLGDWEITRTELYMAIQRALDERGIEIPFPQRDLHLRTSDIGTLATPAPPTTKSDEG